MTSTKDLMEKNGYVIIENFLTDDEILEAKQAGSKFAEEALKEEHRVTFQANSQKRDRYFLDSADKISYFFEPNALEEDGTFKCDPSNSLNKVGHALHKLVPIFTRITFSEKVARVCRDLGLKRPNVVQSMYIYKNPRVGGKVDTHKDASYLYTEPQSLYGFWFALDDATLENGCLWFCPGSHINSDVKFRFVRNQDASSNQFCETRGIMSDVDDETNFVPTPVPKGSCVLIHGNVIHRSLQNHSDKPRHVYTFHVYDAESKYSEENWLQTTFESIY